MPPSALSRFRLTWENEGEAARCVNTTRPLTHPFEATNGGLR